PTYVAYGRMDATSATGDFHVIQSCGAHLVLGGARRAEHGVGVRVHECRHQHAVLAIDRPRAAIPPAQLALWPEFENGAVRHQDGGIRSTVECLHLEAAPR